MAKCANRKQEKDGDLTTWTPDIVGSTSDETFKISDMLGLMCMIGGKRALRLNPSELWQAKNPLGLTTVFLDKKGEDGWEITLKDLIDKCRSKVVETFAPVARPEILDRIEKIESVDQANQMIAEIKSLEIPAIKDMASASFKAKREQLGFGYSTAKGVFAK